MIFGYGKLYNRKNELIFDGEWYNNNPVANDICMITDELKDDSFRFGVEEIQIGDHCSQTIRNIILNYYCHLKRIKIGNDSLQLTAIFTIDNCNELESVKIGNSSFCGRQPRYCEYGIDEEEEKIYKNSCFRIKDCEKIKELVIGEYSFVNFGGYLSLSSTFIMLYIKNRSTGI